MSRDPGALELLRAANPVGVDPSDAWSPQSRALLRRILAEPRAPRGRRRLLPGRSPQGLRTRLALGGVGITALVAAVVAVLISGSAAGPAFAGWRAQPAVASPVQIRAAVRSCGLHAPVVLTEQRGPYTAVVFADRHGGSACVQGASMSFVGGIGGASAPSGPGQVLIGGVSGSDSSGHAFVLLAGRVGAAVRSIVIHRSDHVDVTASISHGWFIAWWPASARATGASVTTSSGVHRLALPAGATSAPPSCPRSAGTGCGAVASFGESSGSAGETPGPPLIDGPVAKPFHHLLLLSVDGASKVLVCRYPPSGLTAALQPHGPTGPCTQATKVTRLPPHYPVQKNLLQVMFPSSIWKVRLTPGARRFVVIAYGRPGWGQIRNGFTLSG